MRYLAMHALAALWLFAMQPSARAQNEMLSDSFDMSRDWRHIILYDTDEFPPGFPVINPYNVLALFMSQNPILDHTGKPHAHGHLIQVVVDGGNGIQDPPNLDGTPGGDDSLAYGNFGMIRMMGELGSEDTKGRTGKFAAWKYFIPYFPDRAYYLRLWEGDNVATAPYYQDTAEYFSDMDRGGAMIRFHEGPPIDVDWKFGPSRPRPQPTPKK